MLAATSEGWAHYVFTAEGDDLTDFVVIHAVRLAHVRETKTSQSTRHQCGAFRIVIGLNPFLFSFGKAALRRRTSWSVKEEP